MYAIQNKRTKKWVYGTDFRSTHKRSKKFKDPWKSKWGHRQFTSFDMALTWDDLEYTKYEFFHRGCGEDYEIVEVKLMPVRYLNVDFTWRESVSLV